MASRFAHVDGTAMTMSEVLGLLGSYHSDVEDEFRKLQLADTEYRAKDTMPSDPSDTFDFRIQVHPGEHIPWSSVFGGVEFMGATSNGNFKSDFRNEEPDAPRLRWRKQQPLSQDGTSRKSKRYVSCNFKRHCLILNFGSSH